MNKNDYSDFLILLNELIDHKFKISNSGGNIIFEEPQKTSNKCEKDNNLVVLLIELKSNDFGAVKNQLSASKNFVEYLINQINTFSKFNIPFDKIIYRGLVFKINARPNRGSTKKNGQKINFENHKNSKIKYTELTCNETYTLSKIKESI